MIYTNKTGLPKQLVKALQSSDYEKKSDYSVTQILKEVRPVILAQRHNKDIEKDVTEMLWSFLGSAVHTFLEKGETSGDITEERLYYRATEGKTVSGKFDLYDSETKTLYDFKITSKWSYVYIADKKDFQKQLSIYAWLLEKEGFKVEHIANILFFRDWGKYDVDKVPSSMVVVEHPILPKIDGLPIQEWLNERISDFEACKDVADDDLPFCTPEYRWAKYTAKVIPEGNKRSVKNFDSSEEGWKEKAEALADQLTKEKDRKHNVEIYGEEWKRCEYCDARDFCNQYQEGNK